jgi:thiamine-phosphate pyrophosphorylase
MLYYRIIDVNINRAREATRVIEDYARFILEDPESYNQIRLIRHNLLKILSVLSPKLLCFRDIEMDPGKNNSSNTKNLPEIIISNFRRLSEALRSITEYLKMQSPNLAAQVEKLRFKTYQLEQRFFYLFYPQKLLHKMRLYILVPDRLANRPIEKIIPELIKGGADAIQLRTDNSEDMTLLKLARKIRSLTLPQNVIFIVNDRIDIALLSQADGVHLGKMDISIHDARRLLGPDKIIGATSHSIEEALEAEKNGADYVSVGPFFTSPTKPSLKPHGFDYIEAVSKRIHIPYIAIGGINKANLPAL